MYHCRQYITAAFFTSFTGVTNWVLSIYDKHIKKITGVLDEKKPACRYIKKEELLMYFTEFTESIVGYMYR